MKETPRVKKIVIIRGMGRKSKAGLKLLLRISTTANRDIIANAKLTNSDNNIEQTKIVFGR